MISLREAVPVSAADTIERGLKNKYKNLGEDTFGVDMEFHTSDPDASDPDEYMDIDPYSQLDDFVSQASNSSRIKQYYYDWLDTKRVGINSRGNDWDDSYGPIDLDTWNARNPEPDSQSEEHSEWFSHRQDITDRYIRWESYDMLDYLEKWVEEQIDNGNWIEYFEASTDTEPQYDDDAEDAITRMIEAHPLNNFDSFSWDVGKDGGDVVEIRTPPMKYTSENLDLLDDVMTWCHRNYYAAGDTSAHIHIGLPKDFNVFDLIAATTLVDENAIKKDISADRELEQFAALSPKLHRHIISIIRRILDETGERRLEDFVGKSFAVENKKLLHTIRALHNRLMGTNIQAFFKHKTLEFRYFSSQVAPHPGKFQKWIKYFMLIPKVAMGRNQCLVGKGEKFPLVFTRIDDDETKITVLGGSVKMPKTMGLPASQLRSKKLDNLKDLLSKKASEKV